MTTNSANIQHLDLLFPDQLFITATAAGVVLCYAHQTTRNKIYCGTFPLPTFKEFGKRLVLKSDLFNLLNSMGESEKKKSRSPCKSVSHKPKGSKK